MLIDLEAEYNNRARVPEHLDIILGWARDAEAYYTEAASRLSTLSYGPSPRQTLDIFSPENVAPDAASVLFIHGGYWQTLSPSSFSHMAKGLNAHGVTVAVAGYDLCPDVGMGEIIEQVISAAKALHERSKSRVVACGHSAGGHLAACLAATDWESIDETLPDRMVPAALAISGLFELEPLVPTSVNDKLGLDIGGARSYSPRLWDPPTGIIFDAWVGGAESAEYLRQSATIAAVWKASGNDTRYTALPGANHFTVIAGLAEKDSPLTLRLVELAKASAAT